MMERTLFVLRYYVPGENEGDHENPHSGVVNPGLKNTKREP
jgi:hypothetical protein